MTARKQQSYILPVVAAVAEGATTPNPGTNNVILFSTTTTSFMRWTGTLWTVVSGADAARVLKAGDTMTGALVIGASSTGYLLTVANSNATGRGIGIGLATSTQVALYATQQGDAFTRFNFDAGGKLAWGSGAAGQDTNLYRAAADSLKTDDLFNAAGGVQSNGVPVVTTTGTETLTNKTLTAPVVSAPTGIVKADVGLSNVDNTSDVNKPVSTAQAAADATRQPLDSDLTTIAALAPANDTVIQRKSGLWVASTMATIKTDLVLNKTDVGLSSVDNTSDAGKPVSTAQAAAIAAITPYTDFRTLGSATAAVVFSGIPSTVKTLRLIVNGRGDAAASLYALLNMRVNGDNTTIYKVFNRFAYGGAAFDAGAALVGANTGLTGYVPAATATAGIFGQVEILIGGWDAPHAACLTWTARGSFMDTLANSMLSITSGTYTGAAPYTALTLYPSAGNFVTGTSLRLVGEY